MKEYDLKLAENLQKIQTLDDAVKRFSEQANKYRKDNEKLNQAAKKSEDEKNDKIRVIQLMKESVKS